jgi:hypothetical protein
MSMIPLFDLAIVMGSLFNQFPALRCSGSVEDDHNGQRGQAWMYPDEYLHGCVILQTAPPNRVPTLLQHHLAPISIHYLKFI